jgi:hypothetical protein
MVLLQANPDLLLLVLVKVHLPMETQVELEVLKKPHKVLYALLVHLLIPAHVKINYVTCKQEHQPTQSQMLLLKD